MTNLTVETREEVWYIGSMVAKNLGADGMNDDGVVIGYMCLVDWQHEIGMASSPSRVFSSIDAAKKGLVCWSSCGLIEVEIRPRRIVVDQDL